MSNNDDWNKLTEEQKQDVNAFRERLGETLAARCAEFKRQHPEIRMSYDFQSYVYLGPAIMKEL